MGAWSWGKVESDFEGRGTRAIWQVDGGDVQADFEWNQPEDEKPSRTEGEVNIIDQGGYQLSCQVVASSRRAHAGDLRRRC